MVRHRRSMIEGVTAIGPKECPRVVAPGTLAIHADLDLAGGQRLFDSLHAKIGLERDRHPPGQDPPSEPVDHSGEIDDAAGHGE